jgi:RimK family alpha-L-glutamate ligase
MEGNVVRAGGANTGLRVAIMTEDGGWHGSRLRRALRARGIEARYLSLGDCRIDLGRRSGVVLPGFPGALPDGVIVRSIPPGTLETITLRLDFLHCLADLGVAVCNDAGAIERTVDKARTTLLLHRAGIPTPPTWVAESPAAARRVLLAETARGGELVAKPLFGSQGKGLRRLAAGMDIPEAAEVGGVWYLQRYVDRGEGQWRDFRVFVVGAVAIAAMARHGRSWISNVAQGARCEPVAPRGDLARLAVDAARAVGTDYAGVDLLLDREGRWQVLEVNGIPAWKGLQGVTEVDIAARIVDHLVGVRLRAAPAEAAVPC